MHSSSSFLSYSSIFACLPLNYLPVCVFSLFIYTIFPYFLTPCILHSILSGYAAITLFIYLPFFFIVPQISFSFPTHLSPYLVLDICPFLTINPLESIIRYECFCSFFIRLIFSSLFCSTLPSFLFPSISLLKMSFANLYSFC